MSQAALKSANSLIDLPLPPRDDECRERLAAASGAQLDAVIAHDVESNAANTQERLLGYQLAQSFLRQNPAALVFFDEVEDIFGGDAGIAALTTAMPARPG